MSYIGTDVEVVTFNTATTFDVTGSITVGGTVDGRDVSADGTKLDTITSGAIANLLEDTTPQLGGNLDLNTNNVIGTGNINVTGSITGTSFVSTGDMSFTNNSKAIFGTSPSLEIYHDGSNSILDDVGAGNFKMQLAGADKLEITSTGVSVTGTMTATAFSGDGSSLTGIPHPTLTSLGIANHDDITVDGSGNVGIGSSSPGMLLEVDASGGSANDIARFSGRNSAGLTFRNATSNEFIIHTATSDALVFGTNGNNERLRIDSSGNVGIGTTSPSYKLDVVGGVIAGGNGTIVGGISYSSRPEIGAISNHPLGLITNNTTRMLIDTAGKVGIGTTSPAYNLVVSASGTSGIEFGPAYSGTANLVQHYSRSGGVYVDAVNDAAQHRFAIGGSEAMRINSGKNVLFGCQTFPSASVQGFSITGTSSGQVSSSGASTAAYNHFLFYNGNGLLGYIYTSGSTTTYANISDYRLKTDVTYDWDATTRLKQLKPARFAWIADGDDAVPVDGFLAHEVQDIVPEAIVGTKDAMMDEEYEVTPAVLDDDGNEVTPAVMDTRSVPAYQGIDQSKLVPLLVKTIQELEARITALEAN